MLKTIFGALGRKEHAGRRDDAERPLCADLLWKNGQKIREVFMDAPSISLRIRQKPGVKRTLLNVAIVCMLTMSVHAIDRWGEYREDLLHTQSHLFVDSTQSRIGTATKLLLLAVALNDNGYAAAASSELADQSGILGPYGHLARDLSKKRTVDVRGIDRLVLALTMNTTLANQVLFQEDLFVKQVLTSNVIGFVVK